MNYEDRFLKSLQNPILIEYTGKGPTTTYRGRVTGKSYKFGGSRVSGYVDERDVLQFEEMNFKIAQLAVVQGSVVEEVEIVEVEPEEEMIELSFISLDDIDALTEFNKVSLIENDVNSGEDLFEKGEEWFLEMPRVSKTKAKKVFAQLESIMGE